MTALARRKLPVRASMRDRQEMMCSDKWHSTKRIVILAIISPTLVFDQTFYTPSCFVITALAIDC